MLTFSKHCPLQYPLSERSVLAQFGLGQAQLRRSTI